MEMNPFMHSNVHLMDNVNQCTLFGIFCRWRKWVKKSSNVPF